MRFMNTNFCTETATVVTASTQNAGYPSSNLKNPLRSKSWRSTGVEDESIVFDIVTTEEINSVAVFWPIENGIRLTDGATIKIQANATNVWTAPSVDQALTISNDYSVATHHFSTNQSYRYWRLIVDDPTNPWGYIEIGQVWLGKSLAIENAQNGFKFSRFDPSKPTVNDFGHRYTDEYPIRSRLEVSYVNMEYDDVQILEDAFTTNGSKKPVLFVLDPTEAVFDKDHFVLYGMMAPQFGWNHVNYNIFSTDSIVVEELA